MLTNHPEKVRSILINKPGALGDYIAGTVAIKEIRKNFPRAHIALIATNYARNVMPEGTLVDEIIDYDECKAKGIFAFVRYIRSRKFDLAINLRWKSERDTIIVGLSGAPNRLGLSNHFLSFFYSKTTYLNINETHEFEKVFGVVSPIVPRPLQLQPYIYISEEDEIRASSFIDSPSFVGKKILLVSPFASNVYKSWPVEYFLQTCSIVLDALSDVVVLVSYGPSDASKAAAFVEQLGRGAILSPPTSIGVVAALIKKCHRVLSNNSGIMNIAMAVQTPTTIVSCTLTKLWGSVGIEDVNFEPEMLEVILKKGPISEEKTWEYMKSIDPKKVAYSIISSFSR